MKQLIQNLKTGETILEEIPVPTVRKGSCVDTHYPFPGLFGNGKDVGGVWTGQPDTKSKTATGAGEDGDG